MGKRNSMPNNGNRTKGAKEKNPGPPASAPSPEEGKELMATELQQLEERYRKELQQMADKLAAEEIRSEGFKLQVDNLTQMRASHDRELEARESHIDSAEKEIARLAKDRADMSSLVGAFRQKVSELGKGLTEQVEKTKDLHKQVDEKSALVSSLEARLKERDLEHQPLVEKVENHPLQRENEQLEVQIREVNDKLTSANQSLLDMEAEVNVLRRERQVYDIQTYRTLSSELTELGEESAGVTSFGSENPFMGFLEGQDEKTRGSSVSSSQASSTRTPRNFLYGESAVSAATQTVEGKVEQVSTQTVEVASPTTESSTQTVRVYNAHSSSQTENSQIPETRDASVSTDPVAIMEPEEGGWRRIFSILLILMCVAILIGFYFEEQGIWAAANDVSRMALLSRHGPPLSPWWYQAIRYQLAVWIQVDRVLSG